MDAHWEAASSDEGGGGLEAGLKQRGGKGKLDFTGRIRTCARRGGEKAALGAR